MSHDEAVSSRRLTIMTLSVGASGVIKLFRLGFVVASLTVSQRVLKMFIYRILEFIFFTS